MATQSVIELELEKLLMRSIIKACDSKGGRHANRLKEIIASDLRRVERGS